MVRQGNSLQEDIELEDMCIGTVGCSHSRFLYPTCENLGHVSSTVAATS